MICSAVGKLNKYVDRYKPVLMPTLPTFRCKVRDTFWCTFELKIKIKNCEMPLIFMPEDLGIYIHAHILPLKHS